MMREKAKVVEIDSKGDQPRRQRSFLGRRKEEKRDFPDGDARTGASAILDETGQRARHRRAADRGYRSGQLGRPDNATVVITHYQRLLDYIVPDVVHVLYNGRIIHSAGRELALKLEEQGYDWLINEYK